MPYTYTKYAGSPNIFENASGRVISEDEAKKAGLFTPSGLSSSVEQRSTPRPDVKVEADFARLNNQNLDPSFFTPPKAVTNTDGLRTGLDKEGINATDIVNQDFKSPGDFTNFMSDIKERFKKSDEQISKIAGLASPTDDEKSVSEDVATLEDELRAMVQGVEERPLTGTVLKSGIAAEIQNITQGNTRESLVLLRRMDNLNRKLTRLQGNRQAQFDSLKLEYDLTRQNINDAINFYKLTAPDQLAIDEEQGKAWFRNPITGEVTVTNLPEFKKVDKAPASVEEYNYLLKNGLIAKGTSYLAYQKLKATQYGTEGGGSNSGGGTIGNVKISGATMNVLEGGQKLADLTSEQKTKTIAELRELGFYGSTAPQWFVDEANSQAKASLTPATIQKLWDETRKLATDQTSKSGGGGSTPPWLKP